jgi:hypothetical protein
MNTFDLAAECGYDYTADLYHDDQPFPLNVKTGRLISVPYSVDNNDVILHRRGEETADFVRQIKDHFDTVYEEGAEQGRVMCIALHPYWVGQPHRIRVFRQALEYILSHSGVWVTTGGDIADWFNANHRPAIDSHLAAREDNSWSISPGALEIWKKIQLADPDSKEGICLRMAIATGLRPPGTGAPGSGQTKPFSDPVVRYKYFKTAHANKELFPSFDQLTVWDLQFVMSSGGSEADLTWGREMVNAWRPDLRINEKVVDTTSQVWRRNSPIPHVDYKAVLAGGGKCGPRSSWSVFICQAFGIPAIGVGQPAHACVAYRSVDGTWQVAYGRGWSVSKLEGMSGPDFVAGVESRSRANAFSQVERLRWFAASLGAKEKTDAVLAVARAIAQAGATSKTDLTKSEKAEEAESDPGHKPATAAAPVPEAAKPATKPEPPVQVAPGVIHVEAASFAKMVGQTSYGNAQVSGVWVHDCFTGGKQVHFQAHMQSAEVTYEIEVPEAGVYGMELKLAAANTDQVINARVIDAAAPTEKSVIPVPYTTGLWQTVKGPDLKLNKGKQTIEVSHGFQRGVAFKSFDLKLKDKS